MTLQQNLVRPITLVIWSRISKMFHRSDHHIEMACRAQHLGRYYEGQGHSMTFQHNRVRPITSLFEVLFKNYFTEMIPYWDDVSRTKFGSLSWRSRSQHDLSAKSSPVHNFAIWSRITKLFHRNNQHIETMCRAQIWVATLKVKVTTWPYSKIVSGPKLCYLKSDFTTPFDKLLLLVSNTYSGSISRFRPALVL